MRDLEKGETKAKQHDFAKLQASNLQKEKKKSVNALLSNLSEGKKKRKRNPTESSPTRGNPHLVLDSQPIVLKSSDSKQENRKKLVRQVLNCNLGIQDWWNLKDTLEKHPERGEELTELIVNDMQKEESKDAIKTIFFPQLVFLFFCENVVFPRIARIRQVQIAMEIGLGCMDD